MFSTKQAFLKSLAIIPKPVVAKAKMQVSITLPKKLYFYIR